MERAAKLSAQLCAGGKAAGAAGKKPLGDRHALAVGLAASELFSVRGKVALVTGGSKGIGLMISSGLVSNGCKVYVCSRKAELCEAAAAELNAAAARLGSGGSAVSLPGDLSTLAGVVAVADALAAAEPALHILVNNAGATWGAPLEEYPDEAWQKVFDLNVRHLFNITQKVLPLLKRGGVHGDPARVVNIASIDGIRATQTSGPTAAFAYTTSKGAVVHLTRALSRALGEFDITVNCIAPGVFPYVRGLYLARAVTVARAYRLTLSDPRVRPQIRDDTLLGQL
jgi:NAD(P)-dependent dehydrogenase (short-subunit alcohol dehydrogenase family)